MKTRMTMNYLWKRKRYCSQIIISLITSCPRRNRLQKDESSLGQVGPVLLGEAGARPWIRTVQMFEHNWCLLAQDGSFAIYALHRISLALQFCICFLGPKVVLSADSACERRPGGQVSLATNEYKIIPLPSLCSFATSHGPSWLVVKVTRGRTVLRTVAESFRRLFLICYIYHNVPRIFIF